MKKSEYFKKVHSALKELRKNGHSWYRTYSEPRKNGYRTKLWSVEGGSYLIDELMEDLEKIFNSDDFSVERWCWSFYPYRILSVVIRAEVERKLN